MLEYIKWSVVNHKKMLNPNLILKIKETIIKIEKNLNEKDQRSTYNPVYA